MRKAAPSLRRRGDRIVEQRNPPCERTTRPGKPDRDARTRYCVLERHRHTDAMTRSDGSTPPGERFTGRRWVTSPEALENLDSLVLHRILPA